MELRQGTGHPADKQFQPVFVWREDIVVEKIKEELDV